MLKVSIITAVYNNHAYIEQCILSVQSQTYPNIEHIIIDGNSNDGTLEIIRKYQKQGYQWISEPDNGIYDALNKGIGLASGDIIGLLHSDDQFANPFIIENVVARFTNTDCDATYGDLLYISRTDPPGTIRYWKSCPFNANLFRKGWMPAHPTLFMKKSIYDTFGLFNVKYRIASDYDLMLRTVGSGKLKCEYLPEIITHMRVGGASNKSFINIWLKSYEDWQALRTNKMGGLYTLFLKNFSKLGQFFHKRG